MLCALHAQMQALSSMRYGNQTPKLSVVVGGEILAVDVIGTERRSAVK